MLLAQVSTVLVCTQYWHNGCEDWCDIMQMMLTFLCPLCANGICYLTECKSGTSLHLRAAWLNTLWFVYTILHHWVLQLIKLLSICDVLKKGKLASIFKLQTRFCFCWVDILWDGIYHPSLRYFSFRHGYICIYYQFHEGREKNSHFTSVGLKATKCPHQDLGRTQCRVFQSWHHFLHPLKPIYSVI